MADDITQVYLDAAATADTAMAEAFGPRWRQFTAETRRELTDDAWRQWATTAGTKAGLVSMGAPRKDRRSGTMRPGSIELRSADMTALAASFLPTARRFAQQRTPTEPVDEALRAALDLDEAPESDLEPVPGTAGTDALTRAGFSRAGPIEQLQLAAPEKEDTRAYDVLLARVTDTLTNLDQAPDPSERARALLVRLHLGQRVIPNAPSALYPPRVYSKAKKAFYTPRTRSSGRAQEGAFDDFMRYHAIGRAQSAAHDGCPTCSRLARFVRVQGMTPRVMAQVMSDFITLVRTGTG
jgi:hypothetical protein